MGCIKGLSSLKFAKKFDLNLSGNFLKIFLLLSSRQGISSNLKNNLFQVIENLGSSLIFGGF